MRRSWFYRCQDSMLRRFLLDGQEYIEGECGGLDAVPRRRSAPIVAEPELRSIWQSRPPGQSQGQWAVLEDVHLRDIEGICVHCGSI
jgi:hypothetical protein